MASTPEPAPKKPKLRIKDPREAAADRKAGRKRTSGRQRHRVGRKKHALELAGQILIGACVIGSPWAFGSVSLLAQLFLGLSLILTLGIWFVRSFTAEDESRIHAIALPVIFFLAVSNAQLVPLPSPIASRVAGQQNQIRQDLATSLQATHPQVATANTDNQLVTLNYSATREQLAYFILIAAAFFAGMRFFNSRYDTVGLAVALMINGILLSVFGLFQKVISDSSIYGLPLEFGGVPFASFVNRNNASGYLLICLASGLAVVFFSFAKIKQDKISLKATGLRKKRFVQFTNEARYVMANLTVPRILLLAGVALIVVGIAASLSRGGMIAMASTVIASMLFLVRRKQIRSCVLLLLFLVPTSFIAIIMSGLQGEIGNRLDTLQSEELLEHELRPQLWADSLQAVNDFPILGSGLGTFRYVYREYQTFEDLIWCYHAENVYVELLITIGLPAVCMLLGMAAYFLVVAIWFPTKSGNPLNLAIGALGFFVIVSQAIANFFDFGLFIPSNGVATAVLMGALVGCARAKLKSEKDKELNHLWLPKLINRPLIALLIAGSMWNCFYLFNAHFPEAAWKKSRSLTAESLSIEELTERIERLEQNAQKFSSLEIHEFLTTFYWLRFQHEFVEEQLQNQAGLSEEDREALWKNSTIRMLNFQLAKMTPIEREAQLKSLREKEYYLDNIPKSIEHAEQALQMCPLSVRSILALAEYSYFNDFRPENYVQAFYQFNVKNVNYFLRLGDLAASHGLQMAAFENWQQAMKMRPDTYSIVIPAALAFFDADSVCRNLIPDDPALLEQVADQLFSSDENLELRQIIFRRMVNLLKDKPTNDAKSNFLLGRGQVELGDPQAAIQYYEIATSLNPLDLNWKEHLAKLYWMVGRRDEAIQTIRDCLATEPGNSRLMSLMKQYQ